MQSPQENGIDLAHARMRRRLTRDRWLARGLRALRQPWKPVLKRCGLGVPSEPQSEFINSLRGPKPIRSALSGLPPGFITRYSLHVQTAGWIYRYVQTQRPKAILELGCGISTVLLALALQTEKLDSSFISLESEASWLDKTRLALAALGLNNRVKLQHAPIAPFTFRGRELQVHRFVEFKAVQPELFLVDAPPAHVGRAGALPGFYQALAPNARLVLDDAERDGERDAVQSWCALGLARLDAFVPVGRGLALLTLQKQPGS